MNELRLPFTERLSTRRRLVLDVLLAALLAAASSAQVAADHQMLPVGPGWMVLRYLAVAAACGSLPFRRRFAVPVLGVVAVAVALVSALGGYGGLAASGGGLVLLALAPAVYSVTTTATSPGSLTAVGAAVAVIEAGALSAVGGPDWGAAVLALALAAAGWLAGENTRARHTYLARHARAGRRARART